MTKGQGDALCSHVVSILTAYSNILFLNNARLGFGVLALSFIVPNIGACGLVAAIVALVFGRLVNSGIKHDQYDYPLVNVILIGFFCGMVFRLDCLSIFLVAIMALATMAMTVFLSSFFAPYRVPVLSLPFSILGLVLLAVAPQYSGLFVLGNYELPVFAPDLIKIQSLNDFGKCLAELVAIPYPVVGLLLALFVLLRSRLAFLFMIIGFLEGQFLELMLAHPAVRDAHQFFAFNDILTAMALGSVFLVPSARTFVITIVGVAITVILGDALQGMLGFFHLPVLTIPFCLTVGTMLILMRALHCRDFVPLNDVGTTSESALEKRISSVERFQLDNIQIGHPVSGQWKISQGRNGLFTHQPPWQYAIDLVGVDSQGKSFKEQGRVLEDYYAYKRPILAPVSGYVTEEVSHLADCSAGAVDHSSPWGNYVIIKTLGGLYVELSHLMQNSLLVRQGDYVTEGMPIAAVGNSGNSPEPHLHIQAQYAPYLGAASVPFKFVSYIQGTEIVFSGIPSEGQTIEMLPPNLIIDQALSFVLGTRLVFCESSDPTSKTEFHTQMDSVSGYLYFSDESGNRLYFSKNRHYFCFFDYFGNRNSTLKRLYSAASRIPVIHRESLTWSEILPTTLQLHPLLHWLLFPFSVFTQRPFLRRGSYSFGDGTLHILGQSIWNGKVVSTRVELDPAQRIVSFEVGGHRYELNQSPGKVPAAPKPACGVL